MAAAAVQSGTYVLTPYIWKYWNSPEPADAPVSIDDEYADEYGGYLDFTEWSTSAAPACSGAHQSFRFSWTFSKDVSVLTGSQDTPLVVMNTLWEGDSGTDCVDVNPFVWIRSGGRYGDNAWANDGTFRLAFVNQGGENRVYFKESVPGPTSPTVIMNFPVPATAGIEIMPAIPYFGNPFAYVYVWQRQPDPVNHAPTAAPQAVTTGQGIARAITLSASDPDGDALTYAITGGPSHGTLSGTAPILTYTPAPGYAGPDAFTFSASDGRATSAAATVSITVTPPPPPTPVVKVKAVSGRSKLKVDIDPNVGAKSWRFQVQRQLPDGSWTTLAKVYRTKTSKETRTINLRKGWYRVVTLPDRGYASSTSTAVWLKR